jgi:hypothetical protein
MPVAFAWLDANRRAISCEMLDACVADALTSTRGP